MKNSGVAYKALFFAKFLREYLVNQVQITEIVRFQYSFNSQYFIPV